ncbi:cleavage stimulation factor subunit [Perkinsela sp. CCAP 1560/4]|nr:cleavage stimulation factor subunit [Perkinsela sp. CCAP 1560/4]|eukprot:KNH06471.1 cleavage stimulation factor subunit [Perkinsela sp. CCAP 1560/4]
MNVGDKRRRMYELITSQLASDGYIDAANYVAASTDTSFFHGRPCGGTLYEMIQFYQDKSQLAFTPGVGNSAISSNDQYIAENFIASKEHSSVTKKTEFVETSFFSHRSITVALAQSANGELVSSSTSNGEICLHSSTDPGNLDLKNISTRVKPFRYYSESEWPILAMSFHPTKALLFGGGEDGILRTFSYDQENIYGASQSIQETAPVTSLSAHPFGSHVLYTTRDNRLNFYEVENNRILTSKPMLKYKDQGKIDGVRVHPFGSSFSYISNSNEIVVHDGGSTKELYRVRHTDAECMLNSIEYSKSGNLILSAASDGTVSIWDLRKFCSALKLIQTGPTHDDVPMTAKFLWKEDTIICNHGSLLKGFDINTGALTCKIENPSSINTFLTSPIKQSIVTSGGDMQIRFFDAV